MNALLGALAPVVIGSVSAGRLSGSYRGYAVQARPHSGYPIKYLSSPTGPSTPEPVNMLHVTLTGVAGGQTWHCQSSASSHLQDLTSRFTAGPALGRFKPGEFKFEGVDRLNEAGERAGEKLASELRMPLKSNADPALQERLIAAGLFDELEALRLGAHPYLPKVQFLPGASAMTEQVYMQSGLLARMQPGVEERLRAAGMADFKSLWEEKVREAEARDPGRLELDVEAGTDRALTPDQFRDALEHVVRIAEINGAVNQRSTAG